MLCCYVIICQEWKYVMYIMNRSQIYFSICCIVVISCIIYLVMQISVVSADYAVIFCVYFVHLQ